MNPPEQWSVYGIVAISELTVTTGSTHQAIPIFTVLTPAEREALEHFVSKGDRKAREITRARILLLSDAGKKDRAIMAILHLSRSTILKMRKKYVQTPQAPILDLLKEAPRSGRPIQIDSRLEANITMIACSDPPEGFARWTLQMIADKVVEMNLMDTLSYESVRSVLKKQTEALVKRAMVYRQHHGFLSVAYGRCA